MKVITDIEIVYTFDNGVEVKARVSKDSGWQQWGADDKYLGHCVDLTDAIQDAFNNNSIDEDN